jgi:hypothetical protein
MKTSIVIISILGVISFLIALISMFGWAVTSFPDGCEERKLNHKFFFWFIAGFISAVSLTLIEVALLIINKGNGLQ